MGQLGHGPADRALRQIDVAFEHGQDMLDLDVARALIPAIVVGGKRQGAETNFRLARELGLLKIGHADYMSVPTAVKMRLRPRRKLRPLHAKISSAVVDYGPLRTSGCDEHVG